MLSGGTGNAGNEEPVVLPGKVSHGRQVLDGDVASASRDGEFLHKSKPAGGECFHAVYRISRLNADGVIAIGERPSSGGGGADGIEVKLAAGLEAAHAGGDGGQAVGEGEGAQVAAGLR